MMTVQCYVPGCTNRKRIRFLVWLDAVLETWSFKFYVCPPHYGLFDPLEEII